MTLPPRSLAVTGGPDAFGTHDGPDRSEGDAAGEGATQQLGCGAPGADAIHRVARGLGTGEAEVACRLRKVVRMSMDRRPGAVDQVDSHGIEALGH